MHPGVHAEQRPDHPAYVMAGTGEVVTYRQLDERANRLSQLLHASGLKPGDHVALFLENHPRYLEVLWGYHYAGLIYTAASSRLTAGELQYILEDCGARALVTSTELLPVAAEAAAGCDLLDLRLVIGPAGEGFDAYEDAVAAHPGEPLPDRVEGMDMLYSSGTTGRPKGVALPFRAQPLGSSGQLAASTKDLFGMDAETVYLSPAPLYHAAPLRSNMGITRRGATTVIMEHFDPERFLALVERYRVTHTQVVPTMFVRLLKLPEEVRNRYDTSSLEGVVHAAAPCPVEVKRRMIDWWGPIIHEYYAGTEGNGFVYCNSDEWLAHPGTVGRPLVGKVHIVGDDGEELPAGREGRVYFSGGPAFEYHNDPAKTAETRNDKGWTTLGDVGYLDDDGYLYLTDRASFMIISGGVNIYPQEVENLLVLHDAVADVAVFGVPNPDFGEEVKAVVQAADPAAAGDALAAELLAYCRANLSPVKCPRSIEFMDELPRHPTGKLYKRLLRDRYWEGHATRVL